MAFAAALFASHAAFAATFSVTTNADTGAGSLSDAISQANASAGPHTIIFNIGAGGVQAIGLSTALPAVTQTVTIDGTTQPGFDPLNPKPMIDINGGARDFPGFVVSAANCIFRGLIVRNFGKSSLPTISADAFHFTGAGGNTIELCWIGLLSDGLTKSRVLGDGIVFENCPNNTVGGTTADKRCVIAGCNVTFLSGVAVSGNGIHCTGAGCAAEIIEQCYIGTSADGATGAGCGNDGILCENTGSCTIADDLISGNGRDAVECKSSSACTIRRCTVGPNAPGTAVLANVSVAIRVQDSPDCIVGGVNAADACTICGNGSVGILITGIGCTNALIAHDYVGTDANGHAGFGNGGGGISVDHCTGTVIRDCVVCANQGFGAGIGLGTSCANATVDNCYVGLNPDGVTPNGNGTTSGSDGLLLNGATGCTIQNSTICSNGKVAAPPQVNIGAGINLSGSATTGNVMRACTIGMNTVGGAAGNARAGVFIQNFGTSVANGNTLGGPGATDGNVIAFNHGGGLTDYGGTIFVLNNRFIQNDGLPIDLVANDNEGDMTPTVPGTLMNKPTITKAETANLHLVGALGGMAPNTMHTVVVGVSPATSPDAEFEQQAGTADVTTNATGNATVDITLPFPAKAGDFASVYVIRADGSQYPSEITTGIVIGTGGNGGGGVFTTSANNQWGTTAADPVDTRTGEYYADESLDLNIRGPMPLFVARYYASKITGDGQLTSALGNNRAHNFDWKLTLPDATHARIVSARGRVIQFEKTGNAWTLMGRTDIAFQLAQNGTSFVLGNPRTQQMRTFDANGRLITCEDGRGNTHTLAYNGDGTLATVSDGLGRILSFSYTAGKLTAVSDGSRSVMFTYSGGNLASATDTLGHATTYSYDATGLMTSMTRPEGNTPFTQVFTAGKVTSQTERGTDTTTIDYHASSTSVTDPADPVPETRTHQYAATGELTSYVDEGGKTIAFESDATGRRSTVTDRLGDKTTIAFDAPNGLPAVITNAEGRTLRRAYAARPVGGLTFFDLANVVYPDGTAELFVHDAAGNLTQLTDRAGQNWSFTYNNRGQVLTTLNPLGGGATFTYDAAANLISAKDTDTDATIYAYDALSRPALITRPGGTTVQIFYDARDRITSIIDERGKPYTFAYDSNDRLTGVTDPDAHTTQYTYDVLDRVTQLTDRLGKISTVTFNARRLRASMTDRNGNTTSFGYDARQRPTSVTDAGGKTWSFGYDDEGLLTAAATPIDPPGTIMRNHLGRPVAIGDPLGNTATLARDAMQRVTGFFDPLGRATNFAYDPRGDLIGSARDGIGAGTFTRDALGRVTKIIDLNGAAWDYTYTSERRLLTMRDSLGKTWMHTYDPRGRRSGTTFPDATTEAITYDGASNVTLRQFTDGTSLNFAYDNLGRLIGADGVAFTRDAEGRITNSQQATLDCNATYDDAGRLKTYSDSHLTVTYAYDSRDRLTSVSDSLNNTITFAYDDAGRLTSLTRPNHPAAIYTYDAAGRLTRIQDGGIDLQYSFNAADEITAVNYTAPAEPTVTAGTSALAFNAASEIATSGYIYDARGRLTASPGHTFAWDGASRLKSVDSTTLTYNALGDVITRTAAGATTHFFYNYALGLAPIVAEKNETAGSFTRSYVRTPSGALLYSVDALNVYSFYHFDHVGSTLALTDVNGNVTDSYAYSPYGELFVHNGTSTQPFTFIGEYGVRAESGLHQMRARYYDPLSARFLSRDPLGPRLRDPQSLDLYSYASENPLRYIDPAGSEQVERTITYIDDDGHAFLLTDLGAFALVFLKDRGAGFQPVVPPLDGGEGFEDREIIDDVDLYAKPSSSAHSSAGNFVADAASMRGNAVLEFGGEVGGPVVKDRLWFWGSGNRNKIEEATALATTGAGEETPFTFGVDGDVVSKYIWRGLNLNDDVSAGIIFQQGLFGSVNLEGFVVNSHTGAFDLSVFGFEPAPIVAAP